MFTRLVATVAFAFPLALPAVIAAQEESEPPAPAPAAEPAPEASEPEPEPAAPAQESAGRERAGGFWSPPPPSPQAFDWIRLKSGEWLKGEIKRMRDAKMRFDSDELDEVDVDWSDITALRSPRLHTYIFEGRRIFTGTAAMDDGRVVVATDDGEVSFSRKRLVGIVSGDQSELSWWSGELSIGLAARSGNTDSTDLTGRFDVTREAAITRLGGHYNGAVSTLDGVETANNHRASLALDVYLSRRFFVTVPSVGWYQDKFQNLQSQLTPGLGLGYDLVKRPKIDWEVGAGAAYQYTEFISVSEGDDRTTQDAAAILGTTIELDLTKDLEWDTDYQLQIIVTNTDLTTHHLLSTFSFDVWGPLDLDVTLGWDRVENPTPSEDGTIPESDDFRLSVGLGIEF